MKSHLYSMWGGEWKKETLEWKNIHMEISEFQQKKSSHPLIKSSKLAIVGLPFPLLLGLLAYFIDN